MVFPSQFLIFTLIFSGTIGNACNAFLATKPAVSYIHNVRHSASSICINPGNRKYCKRTQIGFRKDENGDINGSSAMPSKVTTSSPSPLDESLAQNDLKTAILELKKRAMSHTSSTTDDDTTDSMTKDQFLRIFDAIEYRTSQPEENQFILTIQPQQQNQQPIISYPPVSQARIEMTDMYRVLQSQGILSIFGAVSTAGTMPIAGSKFINPSTLESITNMTMASLTPKSKDGGGGPSRVLLIAGVALAFLEGLVSYMYHIDYSLLVLLTLLSVLFDRLLLNGAIYEQILKVLWPTYTQQVLRHEAGHFLVSYLLGCPVEGCVLSALAAKDDPRFAIARVTAGTSFFDPDLSDQMNGKKPLTRDSIDKFSVIVMGGIAAEAICYGRADGGAGDEESLVRFLSLVAASALATGTKPQVGQVLQPRQPIWNRELIRNQARWGVGQAVMLLTAYKPAYDALVDALERGCKLGECIYAIEKAARDNNLGPLHHPLGKIQESSGLWEPYQPNQSTVSSVPQEEVHTVEQSTDASTTTEGFLKRYKAALQEKLQRLDNSLLETNGSSTKEQVEERQEKTETTTSNNPTTITSSTNTSINTSEEFLKKYRNILEERLKRLQ
jgi:hypothetical protein